MPAKSYRLMLMANGRCVATLTYDAVADKWSLIYDKSWTASPTAFPLSPALPLRSPLAGYDSRSLKRFIENLLPEGQALDVVATTNRVYKANLLALIAALGAETTGALQFVRTEMLPLHSAENRLREVSLKELHRRLEERNAISLTVWDGKARTSLAGVQDKMMVYLDGPLSEDGRMYLVESPLASTHILKPEPGRKQTPHLVVNEHYCMTLARRLGLPVADVDIYRTPVPVLVVRRFDRIVKQEGEHCTVQRLHIIDACQAADLPAAYKYERQLGSGEHVRDIREGVSFEVLFACVEQAIDKATTRLALLRWALLQFMIGNSDAHGKNFSFFIRHDGLAPAPWYDLVSVMQYDSIDHELAMAWGDDFVHEDIRAFQIADFAQRCGIDRRLLRREAVRLQKLVAHHAPLQAKDTAYIDDDERAFAHRLERFVMTQASRLVDLANKAVTIPAEEL